MLIYYDDYFTAELGDLPYVKQRLQQPKQQVHHSSREQCSNQAKDLCASFLKMGRFREPRK